MKITKHIPYDGETRTVTRFLWFPKTIIYAHDHKVETRWLEFASWTEVYCELEHERWIPVCWVDD